MSTSKMPCMNDGLVTFPKLGGIIYWIDKGDIDGRGGSFKVTLFGLGVVVIDPINKVATDIYGRTTLITCKILKGGPDDFGVEVPIGHPRLPPSRNLNAFDTKVFNFGV